MRKAEVKMIKAVIIGFAHMHVNEVALYYQANSPTLSLSVRRMWIRGLNRFPI